MRPEIADDLPRLRRCNRARKRLGGLLFALAAAFAIAVVRMGYQPLGWGGYWYLGFEKWW
jgi:hypothetical protein